MADKPDIEYISRFFVPGSDAPQVAPKQEPRKTRTTLPGVAPREKIRVYVDPVALGSVIVAVVILILMTVSVLQFEHTCEEYQTMQTYLTQLRDDNVTLEHTYRTGYDLETVEEQALALGMVPATEVKTIHVQVAVPVQEPEPTAWDDFIWFLEGLFA